MFHAEKSGAGWPYMNEWEGLIVTQDEILLLGKAVAGRSYPIQKVAL